MQIQVIDWYNRKLVIDNPDKIFIFGENEEQQGKKERGAGQAIIRDLPNTFGFRTKKSIYEHWSDENYSHNIICIEADIERLLKLSKSHTLVFPKNGLGTGLSRLPLMAPKSFLYLSKRLLDVFGYNNLQNLKSE